MCFWCQLHIIHGDTNRTFSSWYQTALGMQLYCWMILFSTTIPSMPAITLSGIHWMCTVPPPWAQLAAHPLLKLHSPLPLYQANDSVHFQWEVRKLNSEYHTLSNRVNSLFPYLPCLALSLPAMSNSEHAGVVGVYRTQNYKTKGMIQAWAQLKLFIQVYSKTCQSLKTDYLLVNLLTSRTSQVFRCEFQVRDN